MNVSELKSGLFIVIEELDKLKPKTVDELAFRFKNDFGLTYFPWLSKINIFVNRDEVLPLDPCFVTSNAVGYEWEKNDVKIIPDEKNYYESIVPIKMDDGSEHQLIIRASKIPFNFAYPMDDNGNYKKSADQSSTRFRQLKEYNGILFRRLGRLMDVSTQVGVKGFSITNNSRYWVCEIEFPPELDEEFEVTTSKQQLIPSQRIWDNLRDKSNNNIFKTLKDWTKEYDDETYAFKQSFKEEEDQGKRKKESEIKMRETKLRPDTASEEFGNRVERREERKNQKIDDIATSKGISIDQAQLEYETLYADEQYKVTIQPMSSRQSMFTFDEHGSTLELIINKNHLFFKKLYNSPELSPKLKTNLELFLFCMADRIMPKDTRTQNQLEEYLIDVSNRFRQVLDTDPTEEEISEQEVQDDDILDDDLKDILEV